MASPHLTQAWPSSPKGAGITGRPLSKQTVSPPSREEPGSPAPRGRGRRRRKLRGPGESWGARGTQDWNFQRRPSSCGHPALLPLSPRREPRLSQEAAPCRGHPWAGLTLRAFSLALTWPGRRGQPAEPHRGGCVGGHWCPVEEVNSQVRPGCRRQAGMVRVRI